jgi:thiamine-phosphate pyrophosphorylase
MTEFARLNAIVDQDIARRFGWTVPKLAEAYLDGGARFLQVRAKNAPSGEYLDLCHAVVSVARKAGAVVIVNDRADIALLAGASGVHVGQDDLPAGAARNIVGAEGVVGLSTHSTDQIRAAEALPVDYIAIGPLFGTASKDTGHAALGLEFLSRVRAGKPLVAIGGVTLDRAAAVIAAGASSVAVISDLLATGSPGARVRDYVRALE